MKGESLLNVCAEDACDVAPPETSCGNGETAEYPRVDVSFLSGQRGLEIAGPSEVFGDVGPVPLYSLVRTMDDYSHPRPVRWGGRLLEAGSAFHYAADKHPGRQWVGDATDMAAVPAGAYDCVVASHILEHLANPIKATQQWLRVLNSDGVLLLVVPHRDGTFDRRRPVTPLAHLVDDFDRDVGEDDRTHHPEVRELSEEQSTEEWYSDVPLHRGLHHHVFDTMSVINLFGFLGLRLLIVAPLLPYHIVIAGRKGPVGHEEQASGLDIPSILADSPFPTDHQLGVEVPLSLPRRCGG
jgi:SAM-dependent methyltransferase